MPYPKWMQHESRLRNELWIGTTTSSQPTLCFATYSKTAWFVLAPDAATKFIHTTSLVCSGAPTIRSLLVQMNRLSATILKPMPQFCEQIKIYRQNDLSAGLTLYLMSKKKYLAMLGNPLNSREERDGEGGQTPQNNKRGKESAAKVQKGRSGSSVQGR